MKKIKYMFSVYSGATPDSKTPEYWDGSIVWITPADYKTSDKYVSHGSRSLTEAGYNASNTTIVPAGSIIVSKRAPIGTVCIAGVPLCTNQGCLACVPNDDVDSTFAYYSLSAMDEKMRVLGDGTTFKEISANAFCNLKIPCYTLPEQHAIVRYLDTKCAAIDEAIDRHKRIIEKLEEYRTKVVSHAVMHGLHSDVEEIAYPVIGTCPSHWQVSRLKFSATVVRGGSPRPIDSFITDKDGFNWIKISDATENGKYINSTRQQIIPEGLSKTRLVHPGTLLLTNSMSFGHPYILNVDGCIHDGWLAFSNYEGIEQDYLYYYLMSDSAMNQFVRTVEGSVVNNLNIEKVKNSLITIPPTNEQNEIVAFLDKQNAIIDNAIESKQAIVAKLEEYRKSIIYYAVTGKIDCREMTT